MSIPKVGGGQYGMFGLTEEELRRQGVTLLPEEAVRVLDAIIDGGHWRYKSLDPLRVEVFYEGRWLGLSREDLAGQVATTVSSHSNPRFKEFPVAYYRDMVVYGARVTDTWFSVLDSLTDG